MLAPVFAAALLLLQQAQQPPQPAVPGPPPNPAAVAADTGSMRHTNGRTPPVAAAVRLAGGAIHLDGRIDEAAWQQAEPITSYTQRAPHEGDPATERTEVRVGYDDEAIYVAARLFDSDPAGIRSQLARRDANTEADHFDVAFDSYHDHNSSFGFGVNPSGVKVDRLIGQDGYSYDEGWDPVWDVATGRDSLGWTVEMRIPLSQLRFSTAETQVWGVNFFRHIQRKAEDDVFAWSPQNERGYASFFGHLFGLSHLPQPRRLEVLPYTTAREERIDPGAPGNPFNDGSREIASAGLDLKYGLTSNLTLDATFNPDFGQVEADPAYVNLSAFEQFFEERRPFFIEGADIFRFGGQQFFYSRRIGREPQGFANSRGGFVDQPQQTTILGAAKLSGRTAGGWSVGLLEAATAREFATVDSAGVRFRDEVEPFTNYFVIRGKRDFHGGSNQAGFMATAVNRSTDDSRLAFLRTSAYAVGFDFGHRFSHNRYNLTGSFGFSRIAGDTAAIRRAQRSSARYYQRPDADYVEYDSTRTSLTGWTATLSLNKEAGRYQFGLYTEAVSPGFDLNDAGFLTSADYAVASAFFNRRWTRPGKVFRYVFLGNNAGVNVNFGGVRTNLRYNFNSFFQFLNYWGVNAHYGVNFRSLSQTLTRGGPLAYSPTSWNVSAGVSTDSRKRLSVSLYGSYSENLIGGSGRGLFPSVSLRPSSAISISIGPEFFTSNAILQFVRSASDSTATATYGRRYIFAQIRQKSLDLTTRLNVTFTPRLSLQLYTQPFIATGDYYRFKELARPRSFDYVYYGETPGSTLTPHCFDATSTEIACGVGAPAPAYYDADPDGAGPRPSVQIGNPDFSSRSLRGNAVLRWEYRPGSTLFLVWTTSCSAYSADPRFSAGDDIQHLCQGPSANVFAVKMNYWLSF
jgi:hypothetical protein